jgi:hypothetical protein
LCCCCLFDVGCFSSDVHEFRGVASSSRDARCELQAAAVLGGPFAIHSSSEVLFNNLEEVDKCSGRLDCSGKPGCSRRLEHYCCDCINKVLNIVPSELRCGE